MRERLVIALDSKGGRIVVKGWQEATDFTAEEVLRQLEPYCSGFLCTYVDKEGMMQGTDLEWFRRLRAATDSRDHRRRRHHHHRRREGAAGHECARGAGHGDLHRAAVAGRSVEVVVAARYTAAMNRRDFLRTSSAALAASAALADTPLPMANLGKTGMRITRLTLGGAHMRFGSEENALAIIRRALELGINMFDSAHKYNNGESDACYGKAISPAARKGIFLMSKAEKRSAR